MEFVVKPRAVKKLKGEHFSSSCITCASASGELDRVKTLVALGKLRDPPICESFYHGPVYMAVSNQHCDVAQVLCENGGRVNPADWDQSSPLYLAIYRNNPFLVELLLKHGATDRRAYTTVFIEAVKLSYDGVLRVLLRGFTEQQLQQEINREDSDCKSALVYSKDFECTKLLIQHGALVNFASISEVQRSGDPKTLIYLLENVTQTFKENFWGEYVKLFLVLNLDFNREDTMDIILRRDEFLRRDRYGLAISLLIGKELCPNCPFYRDVFPLDLFEIIFHQYLVLFFVK